MNRLSAVFTVVLCLIADEPVHGADAASARPLQDVLSHAVDQTLQEFSGSKLGSNQLAVTAIDLRDPSQPIHASYRGSVPIYPASVIKVFYLAAAHRWMEDGKLKDSEELRRAMRDMIVDSSNDATHYVLDSVTGTTEGPELPEPEMKVWSDKRNAVNRYFQGLGYSACNMNQKPWGDGPYGRERMFVGKNYENRNALTTDATARLLSEIVLGKAVSESRSRQMLDLLKRDASKPPPPDNCEPDQSRDFTSIALKPGTKLWSKAGWTSTVRHDAAYMELPDGRKLIVVTFTVGHPNDRNIIPAIARRILESYRTE